MRASWLERIIWLGLSLAVGSGRGHKNFRARFARHTVVEPPSWIRQWIVQSRMIISRCGHSYRALRARVTLIIQPPLS